MGYLEDLKRSRPFVEAVRDHLGAIDLQDDPEYFYKGDLMTPEGALWEIKAEVGYHSGQTPNLAVERRSPSGKDGGVWGTSADFYAHIYRDGLLCSVKTTELRSYLDSSEAKYRKFTLPNQTIIYLTKRTDVKHLATYEERRIPVPHIFEKFSDYEDHHHQTLLPEADSLAYAIFEMAGEVGEVADAYKKHIRGDGDLDTQALAYELGDILYGLTTAANQLGYSLNDIAAMNVNKLAKRAAEGKIRGNGSHR